MTDIIERLNNATWSCELMAEAAAEIERLRNEYHVLELDHQALTQDNERLRAALQEIKTKCGDPRIVSDIARRALEPKP